MLDAARDHLFNVLKPSGAATYRRQVELLFSEAARRTNIGFDRFLDEEGDCAGWDDRRTADALNDIIHDAAAVKGAMDGTCQRL